MNRRDFMIGLGAAAVAAPAIPALLGHPSQTYWRTLWNVSLGPKLPGQIVTAMNESARCLNLVGWGEDILLGPGEYVQLAYFGNDHVAELARKIVCDPRESGGAFIFHGTPLDLLWAA